MATTTERTRAWLKAEGWPLYQRVEFYNSYTRRRIDLYNIFDYLGVDPDGRIVGIQICATSGHAAHRKKIEDSDALPVWLAAGGHVLLISWRKVFGLTKAGHRRRLWTPKLEWWNPGEQ